MSVTPLPIPSKATRVLLFGGVFDPPHWAHVHLPIAARDAVLGDDAWLVYVPAAVSPHKPDGPVAGNDHRLAMLRLALTDCERVAVWTDELDRAGPSYWVDTLRRARQTLATGVELRFLIGADQATAFHRWKDHETILSLAEPIVMLRDPAPTIDALRAALASTGAWSADRIEWWIKRTAPREVLAMSSTSVRARLGAAGTVNEVDQRVQAYIAEHGLYA